MNLLSCPTRGSNLSLRRAAVPTLLAAMLAILTGCDASDRPPEQADAMNSSPAPASSRARSSGTSYAFTRYIDRTEGAFLVLVPRGWQVQGGMMRVNPLTAAGGVGNAMEAKINFAIMRDPGGRAAIRWLPAIKYAQPSPYNAMLNGNWNGMPVVAMPSAPDYLAQILFPQLRPAAQDVRIIERKARPDVAAAVAQLPVGQTMRQQGAYYVVDAATITVAYTEGGERFRELLFVAVEGFNFQGVGMWSNPFTIVARAPEAEFDALGPVAKTVVNSFALNPAWLRAEWAGQRERGRIVEDTMRDIARIDAEIAQNRSQTMAQINNEQYLTLTEQERYHNPFTGQEELGSNAWKYRWENASGEIIYTDDSSWDPNIDPNLQLSGYKRSGVVPR